MKHPTLPILIALLLVVFVPRVGAQFVSNNGYKPKMLVYENLKNDTVLRHFRDRFNVMDKLINSGLTTGDASLFSHSFAKPELPSDSLYKMKTGLQMMALNRHNGLEITGQVYGRLDNALDNILNWDDDEPNSVYKGKVQGEIGWNWINSSVFQHKRKVRSIVLDNQIEQAREAANIGTDAYDAWTDTLTQRWNHIIAAVMLSHVRNIDVLNEAYQLMIENDRVTSGDLLEVMNDKMELEFDLAQIYAKDELPPREELTWIVPINVSVDTISLRYEVTQNNPKNRLIDLQMQKLDNDMHLGGWLSTARLTPFARWSTYLDSNNKFSHNADVGVRFTIPLYSDAKRKRQSMMVEKDILKNSNSNYTDEVMARSMQTIDRIRRLNKSIAVEYDHLRQLKKYIAMRQKVYAANSGRYSYIDRLLEYNEYCKSMERLYKQMRDRSLALITLQKQANLPTLDKVVKTQVVK